MLPWKIPSMCCMSKGLVIVFGIVTNLFLSKVVIKCSQKIGYNVISGFWVFLVGLIYYITHNSLELG